MKNATIPLLLAGLLASCAGAPVEDSGWSAPGVGAAPGPEAAPPEARPSQALLYARDGTPLAAGAAPAPPQAHEVRSGEGGRMYILELYQRAVEERDALALQVAALGAEGDRLRASLAELERTAAAREAARRTAEEEQRRLAQENVELAGRLVTAQIRRLQAEKLLLELRLAEQEVPAPPPQATAAAAQPEAQSKP